MNTHKLFKQYDGVIKLADSKKGKLKTNRKALREKIEKYFGEKCWGKPEFKSQGSFPLDTNLNPIKKTTEDGEDKEEYDLDDGVYVYSSEEDRKTTATYHKRIMDAVEGHAADEIDKTTCVRVVYADGHHIDLPCYWSVEKDDAPQLAHKSKGFIDSDPSEFKSWVDQKISNADSSGQLRRMIRYFKGWKNHREVTNSNLNLPSGFIWTILICENFVKDDRDDLAFKETLQKIKELLDSSYACYRPTTPSGEELLCNYPQNTVISELQKVYDNACAAIDSDCEEKSSDFWRKVFGERFPLGKQKVAKEGRSIVSNSSVSAPWRSN